MGNPDTETGDLLVPYGGAFRVFIRDNRIAFQESIGQAFFGAHRLFPLYGVRVGYRLRKFGETI
jgi:hypothetical protein